MLSNLTYSLGKVDLPSPQDKESPITGAQVEDGVPQERSLHGLKRADKGDSATHDCRHKYASAWGGIIMQWIAIGCCTIQGKGKSSTIRNFKVVLHV